MFKYVKSAFSGVSTFVKKHSVKALAAVGAGAGVAVQSLPAHADLLTDTETAVAGAATSALTVGGYVVAGVASLIVIGLIIRMIYKMGR